MRMAMAAVMALTVVVACGPRIQQGPLAGDYQLYVVTSTPTSTVVAVVDSLTHQTMRTLPLGVPSPDWRHYYVVTKGALQDLDPNTGAVLNSMRLDRPYQLPVVTMAGQPGGLSHNGEWVVLESAERTHLLVVDTLFRAKPIAVDLPGRFTFDAISDDGTNLYLIQHADDSHYYVRLYRVSEGRLDPQIVFDKSDGANAMTGLRLGGVASPDGDWLFSVYARKQQSAFVHALWLGNSTAFCLDLAGVGYSADPRALSWSVAMNSQGTRVFAVNPVLGLIADISTASTSAMPYVAQSRTFKVYGQSASLGVQDVQAKELGGGVAVSPDGRTVIAGGPTGLIWIDAQSLNVTGTALDDWTIAGLTLSADGSTVFAISDGGLIAQLSISGRLLSTFSAGAVSPLALMRAVAAS
jgi:hypothetical protein